MLSTHDPDDLVPIGEAARIASVSTNTLRRWADEGLVGAYRTRSNYRRFRVGDIAPRVQVRTPTKRDLLADEDVRAERAEDAAGLELRHGDEA